jgi:hypothetical protein
MSTMQRPFSAYLAALASSAARGLRFTLIGDTVIQLFPPFEVGDDYIVGQSAETSGDKVALRLDALAQVREVSSPIPAFNRPQA